MLYILREKMACWHPNSPLFLQQLKIFSVFNLKTRGAINRFQMYKVYIK